MRQMVHSHFGERWLYDATNQIDADVFNGDSFIHRSNREKLRWWMDRWERRLKVLEQGDEPTALEQMAADQGYGTPLRDPSQLVMRTDKLGVEADKALADRLGGKLPSGNSAEEQIFEIFNTTADEPRTAEQFFDAAENKHSWLAVNPFRLMHKHGLISIAEAIDGLRMYDKWRTAYKDN